MNGVVFQPRSADALQRGIHQLVNAIAPTLGPTPRIVANTGQLTGSIELLDDGGTIARRVIQLANRDDDMGAMLIRQMLWSLGDDVGDGTATAAVIFQAVYNEGLKYIAAGGNGQRLREFLNLGAKAILKRLTELTIPVESAEQLAHLARSVCHDSALADLLGETVHAMGEYGRIEIRAGHGRESYREYVEGSYWDDAGLFSAQMLYDKSRQLTEFENAAILVSDLEINEAKELSPPLLHAIKSGIKRLVIVCNSISDEAIGYIVTNCTPDKIQVAVVKSPGGSLQRDVILGDLALLTGGRAILSATHETFLTMQPEDFGYADRVWARMDAFGIVGGGGDEQQIDEHIVNLHSAYQRASDPTQKENLHARIGRLMGNSATLWVGGVSERDIEARKTLATRAIRVLRGALKEGALPGGGVALLACRDALDNSADSDERAANRILLAAIEAPIRQILANAGRDAGQVMAHIQRGGDTCGFDALSGEVVDVLEAGILDVASVQKAALRRAIESAALALTIDVLVHQPKQEMNVTP